ncbi:hypothetical protein GF361_03855 [Candidatus Woesearchaeota archaeon]|nr:hypothetical protein [Candidatus Woesearchaeota archaeon]
MDKKAQGLPINVIIVAAIALIVLVVLVAIFTGRLGLFGQEVSKVGQECTEFTTTIDNTEYNAEWQESPCGENEREIFTATDANEYPGEHCCIRK